MNTEQSGRGEREPVPQITADDAGCWLDGSQGWHNTYRVADRAFAYGWEPSDHPDDKAEIEKTIEIYKSASVDYEGERYTPEEIAGAHEAIQEVADDATEYLQSIAPEGHYFEWDAGELSLVKADEGLTEPAKNNRGDREPGELPGSQ